MPTNQVSECPAYIRERHLSAIQNIMQEMMDEATRISLEGKTAEHSGASTEETIMLYDMLNILGVMYPSIKPHGVFYDCVTSTGVPYSSSPPNPSIDVCSIED